MRQIQMPSVAGLFYPADPQQLRGELSHYLAGAHVTTGPSPKAVIVPHAGYVYSGPIAAAAYRRLGEEREAITRVVLLAPAHRVALRGIAAPNAEAFRTPLGDVPVDVDAIDLACDLPYVARFDAAFAGEHAIEVQLPFLQSVLGDFDLIPFVVGDAAANQVAELLETLWGGDETLIVISSDLSHYLDYGSARRRDRATSEAIEHMDPERIGYEDACGRNPVNGLLLCARQRRLQVETLDLRNSGDTAGDKQRVVGYGAYAFH
jgi:AmmeMemoRadiSam system protein B